MRTAAQKQQVFFTDGYVITWDGATRFHLMEVIGSKMGNEVDTFASGEPLANSLQASLFAADWWKAQEQA